MGKLGGSQCLVIVGGSVTVDTSPRLIIVGSPRKVCQLMQVYYCLSRKAGHIVLVCYCRVAQEGQPAHPGLLLLRRDRGGLARKLSAKWGDGKGATPGESQGCCVAIRNSKGWDPTPQLHPVRTGHSFMGTNSHGSPGTHGAVELAEAAGAWVSAGDCRSSTEK